MINSAIVSFLGPSVGAMVAFGFIVSGSTREGVKKIIFRPDEARRLEHEESILWRSGEIYPQPDRSATAYIVEEDLTNARWVLARNFGLTEEIHGGEKED